MKKNMLSLRALLFLSVAMGSTFVMDATYSSNSSSRSSINKKSTIKSIERELDRIKRDFQRNHDAQAANRKLRRIPSQIKEAVAQLRRNENHMWKDHERTLNRKLNHVRDYVRNNSNK